MNQVVHQKDNLTQKVQRFADWFCRISGITWLLKKAFNWDKKIE